VVPHERHQSAVLGPGRVVDSRLRLEDSSAFKKYLTTFEGKVVTLAVSRCSRTRTNVENAIVRMVAEKLGINSG
jgi:hypothetical protein